MQFLWRGYEQYIMKPVLISTSVLATNVNYMCTWFSFFLLHSILNNQRATHYHTHFEKC